jgi:hypothetical protein
MDLNLTHGGGTVIAVHHSISGCLRIYYIELTRACVLFLLMTV